MALLHKSLSCIAKFGVEYWSRRTSLVYHGINRCQKLAQNTYVTSSSSSLGATFNSKPRRLNLSISDSAGLFCIPTLRRPEGFYLMKEHVLDEVSNLVNECCSRTRKRKIVEVFDELSNSLCKIADLAEFIRIAHPDQHFGHSAEDACIAVSTLVEQLNTHVNLYNALKKVVEEGDLMPTCDIDKYVGKLFLFDFEQSGIHLPEAKRKEVVHLNEYILQLGQQFSLAAQQPRQVHKEDLPGHLRYHFAVDGDNITINGLYTDAANEIAREAAYKIYLYPSKEQEETLVSLLNARHRLAQLCGYPTFAHRALCGSLAETPETVISFLDSLNEELKPRAAKEYNMMRDLKKNQDHASKELAMWDTPYLTGLARRHATGMSGEDLSPYFSLGACMEGLDFLFQTLYGIRLQLSPLKHGEAWSSDIYKIDVVHETEGLLGHIYCDFYDRSRKPHQDCHFTIVGGKELADGSYQNPVVVLMLMLPSPTWGQPSLLTPSMADNLFHEFGHAMHSMLARTRYQHVTGTRCATDLAEVPSILMEFFASDPRVLSRFARHYKTGQQLSSSQLQALCASKQTFAAAEMQQQVFYSALDQKLHANPFANGTTTTDILQQVQHQYYGLPYVTNTAWQHRFSHLVGYGAKYYSYLLSRGVAAWIWQQYFQKDPFCRSSGEKFRNDFLAHGGSKPPHEMVTSFLGKDVNPVSLTHSLILDLDMRQNLSGL